MEENEKKLVIRFDESQPVSDVVPETLDDVIYEDGTTNRKWELSTDKDMVEVVIHQLSYPEATLWAVVPRVEWESKGRMIGEILELIEKKVNGITFHEAILEQEELMKLPKEELMEESEKLMEELNEIAASEQVNRQQPKPEILRAEEILKRMDDINKELNLRFQARAAKDNLEDQFRRLVDRLSELEDNGDLEISVEPVEIEEQMTPEELSRAESMLLRPDGEW